MMLAKGRSVIRTGPVTLHTQTAIHVAELMTKVCEDIIIDVPISHSHTVMHPHMYRQNLL